MESKQERAARDALEDRISRVERAIQLDKTLRTRRRGSEHEQWLRLLRQFIQLEARVQQLEGRTPRP